MDGSSTYLAKAKNTASRLSLPGTVIFTRPNWLYDVKGTTFVAYPTRWYLPHQRHCKRR
uniref:Uncharacterized protein n=1 Tax=Arundo donax TaxID=35708 RepID=A0A0A9DR54_ARUDO